MTDLAQLVATGVISAVGGVGLWTFILKLIGMFWQREEKEMDRLRQDVADLRTKHAHCEERYAALEARFDAVERHHASLVPRWIKDASKRVRWINDAALMTIFAPLQLSREQVEGRTFAELLDAEAAREIDRLDRSALARPGQAVSCLVTLHSSLRAMHVVKVAGVGRDRELVYEGYAYRGNDPDDEADRGQRRQEEQIGASKVHTGYAGEPGQAGASEGL
jgi:hypothetical protein